MTPEEHDLIFALVVVPGRKRVDTRDAILRHFGTTDGRALGLRLLDEATEAREPDDLEAALILCRVFGFGMEHASRLIDLIPADWHQQHENLVSMVGDLATPAAVDALHHAATWVPDYLDFDDNRALAVKAIWALGAIPGTAPEHALEELSRSADGIPREEAVAQLARRRDRT
jgi:hypothetical protein